MDFDETYAKLNTQQKKAVNLIDGPVLVVAGPGTGKTQLLGMRVANILHKTDTSPSQILCLTFTEKAAINMRERLNTLIGTPAHHVVIKTFHGFGAEIINLYPDYFWNAARLSAAPDALQLEIIESILKKLPHSNPLALRFGGSPTLTGDVRNAIKYAKDAGLTPDKLKDIIKLNLAYIDEVEPILCDVLAQRVSKSSIPDYQTAVESLPQHDVSDALAPLQSLPTIIRDGFYSAMEDYQDSGKTTAISTWKSEWCSTVNGVTGMHKERNRNEWWLAVAEVYKRYRTQLHNAGYFDYADMIIEVISQLEQKPELQALVQERFSYVLIDEFQDTNDAQMRMAHLVADHHAAEGKPNIMAVGDDDQAIYKFQGAELNNLLNFRRSYPDAAIVVLEQNYRSHQTVLDLAKQVIEQADNRLVTHEKDIHKDIVAAGEHTAGTIHHLSYATQADQYVQVAKDIKSNFVADKSMAVIARNNASLRQMASVLHDLDVPVHYEQQNNVFDHPVVGQIVIISRLIDGLIRGDQETVDANLAKTLRHPMWGIKPKELWSIAIASHKSDWLSTLRADTQHGWIAQWLENLARLATTEQLGVLVSEMLGLTSDDGNKPIHNYYIKRRKLNSEYLSGLSAVRLIRSLITDFSRGREANLQDMLRFLEIHEQNEIVLADETPFITAPHAVQLLSAHKAKGLEFDSVYIIDAIDPKWSPYKGGRKPPANLPLRPTGDDWDDFVRLMFVAITRAVSDITITSFRTDTTGKPVLPTPIISNILPGDEIPASQSDIAVETLETNLTWPRLDSSDERQLLKDKLATFQLTSTALLRYLDLERAGPDSFLESHLLKLPDIRTPQQAHGTAVHAALEHGQKLVNNRSFDIDKVIQTYHQRLRHEIINKQDFINWSEEGERKLRQLFDQLHFTLPKDALAERVFRDIVCGDAVLSGTFDRIETDKDAVTIADYKTGQPVNDLNSKTKKEGVKAWRHRRQLTFYALLAKQIPEYRDKTIRCKVIYVESETQKDLERLYEPSEEELERMQALVNAVWQRIQNLELTSPAQTPDLDGIIDFENMLLS